MADEIKLGVKVDGAQKAAQDLQSVADHEKAIALGQKAASESTKDASRSTDEHTGKQKEASEAAHELHMRHQTLLRSVSQLGPEFQTAAEVFQIFASRATGLGVTLGLLGVAIAGAREGFQMLGAAEEDRKKKAAELTAELEKEYQAYLKVAEAAVRAAGGVPAAGAKARAATERALPIAEKHGLSAAGLEELSGMIIQSPGITDAGADSLGKMLAQTYGDRGSPDLALKYQSELRQVRAGLRPEALGEAALKDLAEKESSRQGRTVSPEELRRYLGRRVVPLTTYAGAREKRDAADELREAVDENPALANLAFAGDPYGIVREPVAPGAGDSRVTIGQVIHYHGTAYIGQHEQSAGKTVPSQAP